MFRNKKSSSGFTLIELLVVIAIIALLSSVALVALQSGRIKSRNVRRLGDMAQMNTALELYFNTNKGYPSATNGVPHPLIPNFASTLPNAPVPADGVCEGAFHNANVKANNGDVDVPVNTYYYMALGTPFLNGPGGIMVYPSYSYFFCLGSETGNFSPGERIMTPTGVR